MDTNKKCCLEPKPGVKNGLISGIIYGLIPHSFCLAFALFSMIGAITASVFLKKVLLVPNIFLYLILTSIILASLSVYFYLRKTDCLCKSGIKGSWRYITIIYSTTIVINLLFFYSIIPALANVRNSKEINNNIVLKELSLKIEIPCTGHSFLIIEEIKKINGILDVKFISPDTFNVKYDSEKTSPENISSLEIFKTFKVKI